MPESPGLPSGYNPGTFVRPLVLWPHDLLRRVCEPIMPEEFNSEALYSQAGQMMYALWKHGGIGLAANQLGYENQMIVVMPHPEFPRDRQGYPIVMCNPQIVATGSLKQTMKEGCLSFPGQFAIRRRPSKLSVLYQTIDGSQVTRAAAGLFAQCIQHEVDHLNGIVFTDAQS